MGFRRPLPVLAVLTCAALAAGCGGGPSAADGTATAEQVRKGVAAAYWTVRPALPATLEEPYGQGAFTACDKSEAHGKGAVRYDIEDYLSPKDDSETMAQLLSGIKGALAPQGWTFAPVDIPESAMPDPRREPLHGWLATRGGVSLRLTLHERSGGEPGAGYLDVLSGCRRFGKAQEHLLAAYRNGSSRDDYRPTAASPRPVPTGFPTTQASTQ
ncbi:hypothetical protein NMG29_11950 [Streptomyces cocklensis]|uniref:Lipoprotein n=1 Tax=Actinacidiphila cocklensis TaxID=887465 RepID=A0A9W4DRN0_9ACTN|nr:hypothetical protein [Actinacidiphila cocklensis]MDD1058917.1 hypothetical protein [Actinacidiphila cocklensis]WSX73556.1 hypothetical protein OH826_06640 [Streptomyces sp. NBC_00899]WSX80380.1 hypothetical protein OH826_44870 [Streptomyces sp. NBC_00899]CAG6396432.1 conserved exported hypothetical protein [Actinacidiphila cocklensis]